MNLFLDEYFGELGPFCVASDVAGGPTAFEGRGLMRQVNEVGSNSLPVGSGRVRFAGLPSLWRASATQNRLCPTLFHRLDVTLHEGVASGTRTGAPSQGGYQPRTFQDGCVILVLDC